MELKWNWWVAVLVPLAVVGCGPTTQSQLTRCQSEKKTLLTRIVDEQKRVESLTTQNEQLNARLADSEKQLARLYQQSSGRYASSGSPSVATPAVPPTALSERPNRLIPLGSPGASIGTQSPPLLNPGTRSFRAERADETTDAPALQPSLLAPSNGRSESGWLPKGGGTSRSTAEGTGVPRR